MPAAKARLRRRERTQRRAIPNLDYEIRIVGAPRESWRDIYLALLRAPWPATLGALALGYIAVNAVFALLYSWVGGIDGVRPGSFEDAFYFSIQTMGTIGYGGLLPRSRGANLIVVAQSVTSILVTALSTGLVFAKFSRPSARVVFSNRPTISRFDGVPTLSVRVSNQRANLIINAEVRLSIVFTQLTKEGRQFYRTVELPVTQSRISSLSRAWTVQHRIDAASPLFGETADTCAEKEVELLIDVSGTDDVLMQTVHASRRWAATDFAWGYRFADVLFETEDALVLDLTKFQELEPAPLTREDERDEQGASD
ncbi:MAG: ion channel [Polyangiaceae bacterium]